MSLRVAQAVKEALASGYQIHPQAFNYLLELDMKTDVTDLVIKVVQAKISNGDQQIIILKEDLERVLPPEFKEFEQSQTVMRNTVPEYIKPEFEIIKDATNNIFPIEGLKGFQSLFRSRFDKLIKIIGKRPNAYQIKQIASLKKDASNTSQKIAGLVMDKKVKRTHVELTVDDGSDRIKVIILEDRIRRIATEICLDQMVVLDLQFSKKGLIIAKDIYSPNIPEHQPSTSKKVVYTIFTSDLHIGSRVFLFDVFNKFVHLSLIHI